MSIQLQDLIRELKSIRDIHGGDIQTNITTVTISEKGVRIS